MGAPGAPKSVYLGQATNGYSRDDVNEAHGITGRNGFVMSIPIANRAQAGRIYVIANETEISGSGTTYAPDLDEMVKKLYVNQIGRVVESQAALDHWKREMLFVPFTEVLRRAGRSTEAVGRVRRYVTRCQPDRPDLEEEIEKWIEKIATGASGFPGLRHNLYLSTRGRCEPKD